MPASSSFSSARVDGSAGVLYCVVVEQKDAGKVAFIGMDPAVLRTDSFQFFLFSLETASL